MSGDDDGVNPQGANPQDADDNGSSENTDTSRIDPPPTHEGPRAYSNVPRTETARFDHGDQTEALPADGFTPIPGEDSPASVISTSPSRRNRSRIWGFSAIVLVLVLVIGSVGSELYLRNRTTNCLETAFSELTGTPTSVTLSKQPMLWQAIRGDIPFVQVDTDDPASGEMVLHARAEGLSENGESLTIDSLQGTGHLPFERVTALGEQAVNGTSGDQSATGGLADGGEIRSITGNPTDETIEIDTVVKVTFLPIPVSTTLKPVVEDGRVRFDVEKASAFIFGIPSDFAQQVVDEVSAGLFGTLFDEVSVDRLVVTETGVDFTISGQQVDLTSEQTGGQSTTQCA